MNERNPKGANIMLKHSETTPCCATCEWATVHSENEETVYCNRKKRERKALASCRKYTFDLLKYTPSKPRQVTKLDPTMIEI